MLIFIWQGLGLLALVVPFVLWFGMEMILPAIVGQDQAITYALVIGAIALLISGVILRSADRRFAVTRPGQKHTFFFIPLRFWASFDLVIRSVLGAWGVVNFATGH